MTVITEGGLSFHFPVDAIASKYDEWSFYRNQFNQICNGSKAVDILYLHNRTLWLIEVKDYRINRRTKPTDLADEIALKVRDTLAGLTAAQVNANDATERQLARQALETTCIRVVLHLEQPQKPSKLFPRFIEPANAKMKLKQKMKAIDPHPVVIDQHTITQYSQANWTVRG